MRQDNHGVGVNPDGTLNIVGYDMTGLWRRFTDLPFGECWVTFFGDDPICAFFRDPKHDHAWVIMGEGRHGNQFMIVSSLQLIEDVRAEAELTLRDFGWVSAN